jgi:hypothetical protein
MANREIRRARRPPARATGARANANRSRPFVFGARANANRSRPFVFGARANNRRNSNNNFKNARNNLNSNNNNNFKNARNNKNFAATKIQALFRGAKARKAFQRIRAAAANATRNMSRPVNNVAAQNIVRNMRPEAQAALQTTSRANNRAFENVAVRNAGRRFPGVNWAVITRDQIRPLANTLRRELANSNTQKVLVTVASLLVALYLYKIDPAFMTRVQKDTLRKYENTIPYMAAPLLNSSASAPKRMLSALGIMATQGPTKHRLAWEAKFGNLPNGRTTAGIMLQYITILLTVCIGIFPWKREQTIGVMVGILTIAYHLNIGVHDELKNLYFEEKAAMARVGYKAMVKAISLAGNGTALAGGYVGGNAGYVMTIGGKSVKFLANQAA